MAHRAKSTGVIPGRLALGGDAFLPATPTKGSKGGDSGGGGGGVVGGGSGSGGGGGGGGSGTSSSPGMGKKKSKKKGGSTRRNSNRSVSAAPLLIEHNDTILCPPLRYSLVEEGISRGAYPTLRNFRFLRRLGLKTLVSLTPDEPTGDLMQWCEQVRSSGIGDDGRPVVGPAACLEPS